MAKKRAVGVTAQTFTAQCPCGGDVLDATTGAYQLTRESQPECGECHATITLGKTCLV